MTKLTHDTTEFAFFAMDVNSGGFVISDIVSVDVSADEFMAQYGRDYIATMRRHMRNSDNVVCGAMPTHYAVWRGYTLANGERYFPWRRTATLHAI